MSRYIDADALAKFIDYGHLNNPDEKLYSENDIREMIDMMPTVDALPVRHGKWIRKKDTRFGEMLNDILICSECQIAFSTVTMIRRSYCPNCGARMDEE